MKPSANVICHSPYFPQYIAVGDASDRDVGTPGTKRHITPARATKANLMGGVHVL